MKTEEVKTKLLNIAARLVLNTRLSESIEDWDFSKSTPIRDKRKVVKKCQEENDFTRRLANEIKEIIDHM